MKKIYLFILIPIILTLLLIGFSAFYYFVVFLPKQETAKFELQKQENTIKQNQYTSNQTSLQLCLTRANTSYQQSWNNICRYLGKNDGCIMTKNEYSGVNDSYERAKEECFSQYPTK